MGIQRFGPTVIETAAESVDELGFLSAIMAAPLQEAPRLVYADWLDERGDARGTFLREFVRLARTPGAPLPAGDEFPLPWRQVVGIQSRHLIRARLTGRDADLLEQDLLRRLQPTLHMVVTPAADKDLPPGTTKFGGRPDLPPDVEWPSDRSWEPGRVLAGVFCAQIRLSDLRGTLVGQKLPAAGLLSFFAGELNVPVRFCRAEGGPFVRRDPPAAHQRQDRFGDQFYPLPAGAVRLIEGADLLIRSDNGPRPPGIAAETWDALQELADEMLPQVFRPRSEDGVAHHQFMGNGPEFNCYPPPDLAPGFCRLASFGSEFGNQYYWGDSNQSIFYIAMDDLAQGRFENAKSYCG